MVTQNDAGQRLDRFIAKAVPGLPSSLAQKYIRTRRIKVDGKRTARGYRLAPGDAVQLYINDEFFAKERGDSSQLKYANASLDIIYEDGNVILLNKPAGLLCHSAGGIYEDCIVSRIQAYLYKSGEWHPGDSNSFTPALCNRIDRNTQGLVIAAKNAKSLRVISQKLRDGEIEKFYLAIVHGVPKEPHAVLEGYLFKDSVKNRVYVKNTKTPGAKSAVMEYDVLETVRHKAGELSLLECRLITGRTHQIRAQLAGSGYPILGDSKYGRGDLDRPFGESRQALLSYKLTFAFKTDAGPLSYLSGQSYELPRTEYILKYFAK